MRPSRLPFTMRHVEVLSVALLWSTLILPTLSQSDRPISRQFQWKFANDGLGASLPTCLPLGIIVQSWNIELNDTIGIPPFYMIAWAIGGTPQTSFIGTENRTLSYTVSHPPGTKLMLNVVDSTGSGGGIPPRLFDVIAGQNTNCIPANSTEPAFTVRANVSTELNTCEPWGLSIKGGVPPYNLSIAAVNFPIVTNVTIPFGFDAFSYINRAPPNTQLIAAVSDLNGRWATGTPIVSTRGSDDDTCRGLASSSGNSTAFGLDKPQEGKSNTALIAGVTVPLVVLLLAGAGFAFWFFRRKKQAQQTEKGLPSPVLDDSAGSITPFPVGRPGTIVSTSGPDYGSNEVSLKRGYPPADQLAYGNAYTPVPAFDGPSSSDASSTRTGPSFAAFPPNPTRRGYSKASEAAQSSTAPPDSEYRSSLLPSLAGSGSGQQEIVIQHTDGGVPIRELPPPYADRGAQRQED